MMTENDCKSLRFNTMSAINTRFGRKRGLHDVACVACVIVKWEGRAPNSLILFSLPSLPLPFPDLFCDTLFFRIKMALAVKRSRTVPLSPERVLESLEQKGDGNDGMSSGKESDVFRQRQHTRDKSRYQLSCVTVLIYIFNHGLKAELHNSFLIAFIYMQVCLLYERNNT